MVVSELQSVNGNRGIYYPCARLIWLSSIAISVSFISACTTITTITPDGQAESRTISEFKRYVEGVFRRQNQASSDLMILLMDSENVHSKQYEQLIHAEERLMNACLLLNKMAVMKVENRAVDLSFQYKTMNSISDCDYITRDVETLLQNYRM